MRRFTAICLMVLAAFVAVSCSNISYVQRADPNNAFKDYAPENSKNAAVLGVGTPISARQMTANATISMQGKQGLEDVMRQMSGTYNVAVRWGNGVRKSKREDVLINKLSFNDARTYIEDVFDVQIIREGERRLLILPSASEPRLKSFDPGNDVLLSSAIKGLAEQCGYNLVINENQDKLNTVRVSTHLKDVTCYDAFESLLNPQGLSLVDAGDYYTISGLPSREWTVELFEPTRKETSKVSLSSDVGAGGGSSGSSDSSSSGGDSGSSSGGGSSSGSNTIEVTYERDLWTDLESDLNTLIQSACTNNPSLMGGSPTGVPMVDMTQGATGLLPPPSTVGASGGSAALFGQTISNTMFVSQPTHQAVGGSSSKSSGDQASSGSSSSDPTPVTPCGYVRINRSVGLIQMRAPRNVLDEADDIIQRVQDIASRRILLEARVLAVTRTRDFNQSGKVSFGGAKGGILGTTGFTGSITSAIANELSSYTINNTSAGGVSISNGKNLNAVVGLVEQYGVTTELMHPMIELMDRQRAVLIDGRNEKYFVIKSDTTTGTSSNTSKSLEERSQFIGLQFSASAQISADPQIPHTISLQIPITSISKEIDIPDPNNPTQSTGKAPIANTRLIDQKVRVRDGEIKVIGGLTKTVAVDSESGVPLLRDISAIGRLANEQGITYEQIEFVVLLQVRRLS